VSGKRRRSNRRKVKKRRRKKEKLSLRPKDWTATQETAALT
jgi:hypothetical protein